MDTIGSRLRHARKNKGLTQDELGGLIGASRGVIFNLEKNLTAPRAIVIKAICHALNLNIDWLTRGKGDMENPDKDNQSAKILIELHEIIKTMNENELLYILDTSKAFKKYLGSDKRNIT